MPCTSMLQCFGTFTEVLGDKYIHLLDLMSPHGHHVDQDWMVRSKDHIWRAGSQVIGLKGTIGYWP